MPISPIDFGGPISFRSVNETVQFWRAIEGGGHTWPGGGPMPIPGAGKISTDIAASEAIADFFEAHTL